jgi:hypothetical protein|tara:strand:+ start:2844 stop:3917 length:1074 start_codon:yes stop_codon:yes gene_type:complete
MALPKKVKKNLNITPNPVQGHYPSGYNGITTPNRRKELANLITDDGTYLPKSVLHADMDRGMLDFVEDKLKTVSNGKKVSVIDRILTLQRWAELSQTWKFSTSDKNVDLPFIVVVRNPEVQYGTNPALQYTIPDRKQFHYAKVPTWDGNRKGYDIYTIPQPVPVDIIYDVKIVCNRMRELNNFNRVVLQNFTSRQAYTFIKGHYIPIVMNSIGDESKIDTEERRYYQQNYQFQLQGFLLDEEEFEVKPAISRELLMFGFDEKERQKEGKGSPKNPDKVNTKLTFGVGVTKLVLNYDYKVNISALRIKNVDSYSFYINNIPHTINEVLMVNPGDVLVIGVVKNTSGVATLTLQEKLIY